MVLCRGQKGDASVAEWLKSGPEEGKKGGQRGEEVWVERGEVWVGRGEVWVGRGESLCFSPIF